MKHTSQDHGDERARLFYLPGERPRVLPMLGLHESHSLAFSSGPMRCLGISTAISPPSARHALHPLSWLAITLHYLTPVPYLTQPNRSPNKPLRPPAAPPLSSPPFPSPLPLWPHSR